MAETPSFHYAGTHLIKEMCDWVDSHLKNEHSLRMLWSLGQRTPEQIISSGKFNLAYGCLDKATVLGALLESKGFSVKLVCERRYKKGKSIALHFLIRGLCTEKGAFEGKNLL